MSFLTELSACCKAYSSFTYGGYAVQLPYRLGGKNTPDQIKAAISNWAGSSKKTATEIRKYVTDNPAKTGVDCSGLVYYALNEASEGAIRSYFEDKLNLFGCLSYGYGISAANLTSDAYGTKITVANDIQPGCVIRFDNGSHVLVIHLVTRNSNGNVTSIIYTHSNGSKGPHTGYITIGDHTKDLNDAKQTWNDSAYTDSKAKSYYNYTLLLDPIADLVQQIVNNKQSSRFSL